MEYKQEAAQSSLMWPDEVGQSVDWEVFSDGRGSDRGPPGEGKVH